MSILAYCSETLKRRTMLATGVHLPWTCPPLTAKYLYPSMLAGYKVWYLDLCGQRGARAWYGDNEKAALTVSLIERVPLEGVVIFVANCWVGEQSPMLEAMLDAKAYVVGGSWADSRVGPRMYGTAMLGRWFLLSLKVTPSPELALVAAKAMLRASLMAKRDARKTMSEVGDLLPIEYPNGTGIGAAMDTLNFRVFRRG